MGNLPRSPCAPVGAFEPALNGRGCASPLPRVGQFHGGSVLSNSDNHCISKGIDDPFSGQRRSKASSPTNRAEDSSGMIALSMEFVAKPQEARRLQTIIPSSLTAVLRGVSGFAGCLLMVSDQEARLATVVTLWTGENARERSTENARWVQTLLAPFIDRQLRVQSLIAFVPVPPSNRSETYPAGECSILQTLPVQGEEVCVA
jgi:hypothetical protein